MIKYFLKMSFFPDVILCQKTFSLFVVAIIYQSGSVLKYCLNISWVSDVNYSNGRFVLRMFLEKIGINDVTCNHCILVITAIWRFCKRRNGSVVVISTDRCRVAWQRRRTITKYSGRRGVHSLTRFFLWIPFRSDETGKLMEKFIVWRITKCVIKISKEF